MTRSLRTVSARMRAVPGMPRPWARPAVVAACAATFLVQTMMPTPAYAWWEKLEKLSGPGPFSGLAVDFRVACFGEISPDATRAEAATREAIAATAAAKLTKADESSEWQLAEFKWAAAAAAWGRALGMTPEAVDGTGTLRNRAEKQEQLGTDLRRAYRARSTATSAAGVDWSLCDPLKQQRWAVDVGWSNLRASGSSDYAREPIHLDTLIATVSLRVFASTKWDVLDIGAGAGGYWFTSGSPEASPTETSAGFASLNGVVLQPVRISFHAPSNWSALRVDKGASRTKVFLGRIAAVPSFAFGLTRFPAGFDPGAFGTGASAQRRIPSEWVKTYSVSANVQSLLRAFGK